jgi:crotonobetainyl-CoA:carnitine CoA-transferase CaiB-like acyl-CoA transferase
VPNSWVSYGLVQSLSKDGRWLQFSQATPKLFKAFLQVADLDDPAWEGAWEDEDLDRREAFWERLLSAVRSRTVAEWQRAFDAHPDVFAEIFRSGSELLSHPQMLHDDQVVTVDAPGIGPVTQAKPFVRLSRTPGLAKAPPQPDEHGEALRATATEPPGRVGDGDKGPKGLPLEGVTIVELGSFYAAPFGVTVLADLGARVLKIEPLDGDPIRFQLPMPEIGGVKVTQGKESIAVDIGTPEGLAVVRRLLESADLVLQSFRAGVAKRLGLDEASVRQINPDVIYHEAPGFGTGGPYGHRPAYAPTIGAGSGMARRNVGPAAPERADLTLDEVKDGALRLGAASLTVAHCDGFASLGVTCGQTLGLLARERGAGAQGVVTTMLSTMSQILSEDMVEYEGRPPAPTADAELHGFSPLYRLYEAREGWVFLAVTNDREWAALTAAAPGSGLEDARFADRAARDAAAAALAATLSALFRTRAAAEWERLLTEADVACVEVAKGPCHDVLMNPGGLADQLGMTCQVEHPLFGEHARLTSVMRFSRSATRAGPGVLTGQHTEAVLKDYGYSDAEITSLADKGVILLG